MCTMKREEKDQCDMTTVIFACILVREGGGEYLFRAVCILWYCVAVEGS